MCCSLLLLILVQVALTIGCTRAAYHRMPSAADTELIYAFVELVTLLCHVVAHGFLKAGMFLVLAQAVIRAPYQRMTALDPHTRPMLTCMWSVGWLHSILCYAGPLHVHKLLYDTPDDVP